MNLVECFFVINVEFLNRVEPLAMHGSGTAEGHRLATSNDRCNVGNCMMFERYLCHGWRHSVSTVAVLNDDVSLKSLTRDVSDVLDGNGPW